MNKRIRKKVNKKLVLVKGKPAIKAVRSLPPVKQLTAKELFESKLNSVYGGAVIPVTAYVNNHSTMVFKCSACGVSFFGKASHMVGKEHQLHACGFPYGDKNGTRLGNVGGKNKARKSGAKHQQAVLDKILTMIWNDCTYKEVAKAIQVNPDIIKDYYESEGLIE